MRIGCALILILCSCAPRSGPHKPIIATQESVGYEEVRPIFAKYCTSCHPSRSAPDWLNYQQAESYALNGRLVQRVFAEKSMPPAQSAEAAAINDKDRGTIAQWAKSGAPMTAGGRRAQPMETAVQSCLQCHGLNGPAEPKAARLAGQNEDYLVTQLRRFKWRERVDPTDNMNDVARPLSDATIRKVAQFFASKPEYVAEKVNLPPDEEQLYATGKRLAELLCNSCHMSETFGGRPAGSWLPILKYQTRTYLVNQLLYFRGNERRNPLMHQFVRDLSPEDIESVALYYSVGPQN